MLKYTLTIIYLSVLIRGAETKESMSFFIGTGLLAKKHIDNIKDYEELEPHLEKQIILADMITHFKVKDGLFEFNRVTMEVINRKATYIYLFYTLGDVKPSFNLKSGNYIDIAGYDFADEKGGTMMEKYHYLDLAKKDNKG